MRLPKLIDRAAPVVAVLAELDVRCNEQVLIMLSDGPGFAEFSHAVQYREVITPQLVHATTSPVRLNGHDLWMEH